MGEAYVVVTVVYTKSIGIMNPAVSANTVNNYIPSPSISTMALGREVASDTVLFDRRSRVKSTSIVHTRT
jgi:hypothetical protein